MAIRAGMTFATCIPPFLNLFALPSTGLKRGASAPTLSRLVYNR
jgi:hypothetical protein